MGNCFQTENKEVLKENSSQDSKVKDLSLLYLACIKDDINEFERLSKTIELTKGRILYCGISFGNIDNYKKFVDIVESMDKKVDHKSMVIYKIIDIRADKKIIPNIIEKYKVTLEDKDICFIISKIRHLPLCLSDFYYKCLHGRKLPANIYELILLTNYISDSLFTTICKDMYHLEQASQLTIMSKYQSKLLRDQNKKNRDIILYID